MQHPEGGAAAPPRPFRIADALDRDRHLTVTAWADGQAGRFHPADTFLTREIVARTALGIDLGEQPRRG